VTPAQAPADPCPRGASAPERWTVYVERPFIERIKGETKSEHVTVTEFTNRMIRHDDSGEFTSTTVETSSPIATSPTITAHGLTNASPRRSSQGTPESKDIFCLLIPAVWANHPR
jgi:hypothetical protein